MGTENRIRVKDFVFNPFQENTYLVYDDSGEAVIIDPGHSNTAERKNLGDFISSNGLQLKKMLFTHGHLDHVCGAASVREDYDLLPLAHCGDNSLLNNAVATGGVYGFELQQPPLPSDCLSDGDIVDFGTSSLRVLHAPGHSPGHIVFYSEKGNFVLTGDVLFYGSIGRTDLPGGDYDTLINSIREKLLSLPDDTIVYPGHGPSSTVGQERKTNPFLL